MKKDKNEKRYLKTLKEMMKYERKNVSGKRKKKKK